MTSYRIGEAQSVCFTDMGGGLSIPVPTRSFIDAWTEKHWAKAQFRKVPYDYRSSLVYYARDYVCLEHKRKIQRRNSLRQFRDGTMIPFLNRVSMWKLNPTQFKYDRAVGVEIECINPYSNPVLPIWARQKTDGSIRTHGKGDAIEYNLLLKRSELEVRLHKFCGLIKNHFVNQSCGLHIHLDCRDKSADDVKKIAKRMDSWLYALREFLPESRRDNSYCKFGVSTSDRYRAVNFTAFGKYQTLEVRIHSGTIDYTKIIAWIRLLELLFSYNVKVKCGATGIAALSQLPMAEYERSYWIKRHQALNPRQYNSPHTTTETE
jgi:hypothetical protein